MAAAMDRGVVVSAGRFVAGLLPQAASLTAAARRIPSRVRRGEESATGVSAGTGQGARSPARGSRVVPDMKLDAAPIRLPGRTVTVISRTERPRANPLRV